MIIPTASFLNTMFRTWLHILSGHFIANTDTPVPQYSSIPIRGFTYSQSNTLIFT